MLDKYVRSSYMGKEKSFLLAVIQIHDTGNFVMKVGYNKHKSHIHPRLLIEIFAFTLRSYKNKDKPNNEMKN